MVKNANFKLIANNKDITSIISKNLINLNYEDKEGVESDEISFLVSGLYQKPIFGDNLELYLGYVDTLYKCGIFNVQSVTKNYLEKTTEVRASAVDFFSPQKEKKSRTWENTTLEDIAKTIASNNSFRLNLDENTKNINITSELQDNINDLEFLYIICFKNNYLMKIKNQEIVIKLKEDILSNLTQVDSEKKYSINIEECIFLEITDAARNSYTAVTLEWQDLTEGKTKIIKVGNGDLIYKMKISQPKSEAEAFRQGEAKLVELRRGGVVGNLECTGRNISVGNTLVIKDIGEFICKNVSHNIDSNGYFISIDLEG